MKFMRLLATVCVSAALSLVFGSPSLAEDIGDYGECARLLAEGEVAAAVEAGAKALAALDASKPGHDSLASVNARAKGMEDARSLVLYKMDGILKSAGAVRKSPFLYSAPNPAQLLQQVRDLMTSTAVKYEGLSEKEAEALRSYLGAVVRNTDMAVLDVYTLTVGADLDEEGHSRAKDYLIAYIVAVHDAESYPWFLALLEDRVPGDIAPYDMVERTVTQLNSAIAAREAFEALSESVGWEDDSGRSLLGLIAQEARDRKQHDIAAEAYRALARHDGADGEEAQRNLINMYAEETGDFESAVAECEAYLSRWSSGEQVMEVEFLKCLYEYKGRQYGAALADVVAFREKYPESARVPDAMMLEGLCAQGTGDEGRAIALFDELVKTYPDHSLAARAEYMKGFVHMTHWRYEEAREAFQRVVDFYPDDSCAEDARRYLKNLETMGPGSKARG